ncbi:MAG TPA: endo alpha-1,4 polygalactosaminidase [Pseudonocardiaceae bacterium]
MRVLGALLLLLLAGCAAPSASALWQPAPGTTWQWQLSGPLDTTVHAAVYDVDGVETTAAQVRALHAAGRKVICYVDAGGYEDYRPDAKAFPASVLGNSNNWPGQRWLDIRQIAVLEPIMAARFDTCQHKGFDAIEADEVDGYANDTGFPLTAQNQLAYNRMLAGLAHQRGMSIGLKNDLGQVSQLVNDFQFAIDEQCFQYQECDQLQPFVSAGKAVFEVEYQVGDNQFCTQAKSMGFSSMRKNLALDAPRWPC